MRKISDTIARLTALRARQNANIPGSGSFDRLSTLSNFGSNPGALKARYYLPDAVSEDAPMVVVLHGCTQDAAGYDYHSGWSQLADAAGFALLYPEQQRPNNPSLCFNWFLPQHSTRDRGEAHSIRQMIETMVVTHGLDRKRIFITGLSAGGAMAAAMLASYPEVFVGGGIIAGVPYGSAKTVPEAFDRMRGHGGPSERELQQLLRSGSDHRGPWPKISIWHGSADHTVAPSNAAAIAAQWQGVHKLDRAPTRSDAGRLSRQVWRNASGEAIIEIAMIAQMGHGTPLGDDGLGTPGPYMLDVGISSTREIARFWGIAENAGRSAPPRSYSTMQATERQPSRSQVIELEQEDLRSPDARTGSRSPPGRGSDGSGAKEIIEHALRKAGLMR